MRHLAWLAGCLMVVSCTVNSSALDADAGSTGTGGHASGTGGAGGASATGGSGGDGCPRCVPTGGTGGAAGQTATGGQTGTGGQVATGGQTGSGGQSGSGGQTGTGGQAGGGGAAGHTCTQLESEYASALTAAKACTFGAIDQCTKTVDLSLTCQGCTTYVNDTTELNMLKAQWASSGCVHSLCPAIACIALLPESCTPNPGGAGMCTAGTN